MKSNRLIMIASLLALTGAALADEQDYEQDESFGIVVMAHGGSEDWNAGVLEAVAPIESEFPIEVAFGMADALSIQDSITALEQRGVTQIGVVRLFISGDSWYERTGQILGLIDGAPPRPMHDDEAAAREDGHAGHRMEFWQVNSDSTFKMSREGLMQASEMGAVLTDRVSALSTYPEREDVLILAHGPDDDQENERWLEHMESHAAHVRKSIPVHDIHVATLREDWPEKREAALTEIREFITASADAGREVIVVPFRVHGFGPYADVLEGLNYKSDGTGLVPHASVTDWIRRQAEMLR